MPAPGSARAPVLACRLRRHQLVFAAAAVLAWRKGLSVPRGRGDVNGLLVATLAEALGPALLGDWLRCHERR